jgi:hypothetical protein
MSLFNHFCHLSVMIYSYLSFVNVYVSIYNLFMSNMIFSVICNMYKASSISSDLAQVIMPH